MEENSRICKVCHQEDSQDNPLCYPCKCKGSIKFIHKECLFLFVDTSKKTFCTICKHKYVFEDIFKPGTPEKVPLKLILKGLYKLVKEYALKIGSNLFALLILLLIIIVNGLLMLNSSEYTLKNLSTPFGIFSFLLFGSLTTLYSYTNHHFYFCLSSHIEQVESRRVLRIDPFSAMNSIATDLITSTDTEVDGGALTLFSSLARSFNSTAQSSRTVEGEATNRENMSLAVNDTTIPLLPPFIEDTDYNTNTASSEETVTTQPPGSDIFSFRPIGFSSLLRGINVSLLWWGVSALSHRLNFNIETTATFFSEVYLHEITKKLLILYLFLLLLVGVTSGFKKIFGSTHCKAFYSFTKIYHRLVLVTLQYVYLRGVCVHYIFSRIVNNGLPILDLKTSYFKQYKTLLSLLFHFIVGYSISRIYQKTLLLYKDKFRKGVLHFMADPPSNDLDHIYQSSHEHVLSTILSNIIRGVSVLLVAKYVFFILRGSILSRYYTVSITSVNKALLLFKLIDLVSEPFYVFHKSITRLLNLVIRVIARFSGLRNYLYGDVAKVDKMNLKRFRWLPNTHKYYRPSSLKRKYYKKVNPDDIERYFNRSTSRNYSVFYVPPFLWLRCILIAFFSLTSYVSFYFTLFRFSNYLTSFLEVERFFDNSSDVMLIVTSGTVLQVLRFVFYLLECLLGLKFIVQDFISFSKRFILLAFSLVIWPLWSTFIILVLYSESLRSIYPGRLISLFFSSSSIISCILDKVIFTRNIENYSFSSIFRKLYGFISAMTFIIICISLLRSYSFIVIIESSEIPFLLIFGTSALLFYLKHCIKHLFCSFLRNIKKEHYLLDTNVVNYVEEKENTVE